MRRGRERLLLMLSCAVAVAVTSITIAPAPMPPQLPPLPPAMTSSPTSTSNGNSSGRVPAFFSVRTEQRYEVGRERLCETLGVRPDARALVRMLARGTRPEDGSWVAPSGFVLSSETASSLREWARGSSDGPWIADVAYGADRQKINRIPTSSSSARLYLGRVDTLTGTPALWVRAEGLAVLTVVDDARLESDGIAYESLRAPHSRRVDLVDEPTPQAVQKLISSLPDAVAFIADNLERGGVAVHCMAGESRSASFVVAYLIVHERLAYEDALNLVRAHRPQVAPNPGFERALRSLDVHMRRAGADRAGALSEFARGAHAVHAHDADEDDGFVSAAASSPWSWVLLPHDQSG